VICQDKNFGGGEKCENFSKWFHCIGQPTQNGRFFQGLEGALYKRLELKWAFEKR